MTCSVGLQGRVVAFPVVRWPQPEREVQDRRREAPRPLVAYSGHGSEAILLPKKYNK